MHFKQLTENRGSIITITDERMLSLIKECLDICKDHNLYIDDALEFYQEDMGWTRYGYYHLPEYQGLVGYISLNTKLFNMSDTEIKSVILHELAHYLKAQLEFNNKNLYWLTPYKLGCNRNYERAHHGYTWKKYARMLERASGIADISERTANFHIEDDDGKTRKDYYKYYLVCNKCGAKQGYLKMSKAIQHPEYYRCNRCGGNFHVEEVK